MVLGVWGGVNRELFFNGYEVSVMYDEQLNRDLLYNTVPVVNNTDLHPLKYIKCP